MDEKKKTGNEEIPDGDLKELRTVWGPVESVVIQAFLKSHGIPCIVRGNIDQNIYSFSTDGLGQINIFVLEKDFEIADELLAKLPRPEDSEDFQTDENEG